MYDSFGQAQCDMGGQSHPLQLKSAKVIDGQGEGRIPSYLRCKEAEHMLICAIDEQRVQR